MRFWNFVLFVARAVDASCDFNRRISKSPLRPAASTSTATIPGPDPVRPGAGIIIQPYAPRRREIRPSNPSKTSALKNLSTLRSTFLNDRARYHAALDAADAKPRTVAPEKGDYPFYNTPCDSTRPISFEHS